MQPKVAKGARMAKLYSDRLTTCVLARPHLEELSAVIGEVRSRIETELLCTIGLRQIRGNDSSLETKGKYLCETYMAIIDLEDHLAGRAHAKSDDLAHTPTRNGNASAPSHVAERIFHPSEY